MVHALSTSNSEIWQHNTGPYAPAIPDCCFIEPLPAVKRWEVFLDLQKNGKKCMDWISVDFQKRKKKKSTKQKFPPNRWNHQLYWPALFRRSGGVLPAQGNPTSNQDHPKPSENRPVRWKLVANILLMVGRNPAVRTSWYGEIRRNTENIPLISIDHNVFPKQLGCFSLLTWWSVKSSILKKQVIPN